jgi:fucose permease
MGNSSKRNFLIVGLVFLIFFVISLITNILGPLVPDIIDSFKLSLALAGFLPTSFFIAYGVMSIPAGMLIERFNEKPVLVASFILAFLGSVLFASKPVYAIALFSLFTIGIGVAMLQVAINPLLRVAGGEENFAFYGVMAQLIFGLASFISPKIYSYLVLHLKAGDQPNAVVATLAKVVPASMPWVSLYWVFTVVTLAMVAILLLVKLPKVELKEDEKIGTLVAHKSLLKNKFVALFFIGIFCYVGTEQGVANWISQFLKTYHGLDPLTEGASAVGGFWGWMTVGCAVGLIFLKLFDSRKVLIGFVAAALITLTVALFGPAKLAIFPMWLPLFGKFQVVLYTFSLMGFFASVMWPIVFSLALNSVDKHHGSFSGILVTGIIGGAVLPPVVGKLGDLFGLKIGLLVIYLTLGYLLSIGFWARPLIANATIGSRKKKEAAQ